MQDQCNLTKVESAQGFVLVQLYWFWFQSISASRTNGASAFISATPQTPEPGRNRVSEAPASGVVLQSLCRFFLVRRPAGLLLIFHIKWHLKTVLCVGSSGILLEAAVHNKCQATCIICVFEVSVMTV